MQETETQKRFLIPDFDPETHTNYVEHDPTQMSGKEKVIHFLRNFKNVGVWPSFYDIQDQAGLSQTHLRRVITDLCENGMLESKKTEKGKKIYQII